MKVHEIFRSIQGEGRLAGTPMTFVRLYGCNLNPPCVWCDTPQLPSEYKEIRVPDIVDNIKDKWICITGGEPLIHRGLPTLILLCKRKRKRVAIETNGTIALPTLADWVCVSPKSQWPNYRVLVMCSEIKLLVGSGMYNVEEVLTHKHGEWDSRWRNKTSLLPVWDENYEDNLKRAIELCQKYQVRLTVQIHKYIEVK